MAERIRSYAEFWPHYLRAHRDARTRAVHYLGSLIGLAFLAAAAIALDWRLLLAAPVAGYACAWLAHGIFEGNRPATFGHPLWSLYSDFRMLTLWASGRLRPELDKAERG
jgi:hypothetical protein